MKKLLLLAPIALFAVLAIAAAFRHRAGTSSRPRPAKATPAPAAAGPEVRVTESPSRLVYRAPERPRQAPEPKPADQAQTLADGTMRHALTIYVSADLGGDEPTRKATLNALRRKPSTARALADERLARSTDERERAALARLLEVLR